MRVSSFALVFVGCAVFWGTGCTEDGTTPPVSRPRSSPPLSFPSDVSDVQPGLPAALSTIKLAEIDDRAAVMAGRALPAISGGTLAASPDGRYAAAADPDRDRVSIVDLQGIGGVRHVALAAGSEPGRVVIDAAGLAHVALRGSGDVLAIDVATAQVVSTRKVCAAPRGLAVSEARGSLFVACADGVLSELPLSGGAAVATHKLDIDLRDVAVTGDGLRVSRFKSAELLHVSFDGKVVRRQRPPMTVSPNDPAFFTGEDLETELLEPHVAWRSSVLPDGTTYMLHALNATRSIEVAIAPSSDGSAVEEGQGSAYGSGSDCGGVVNNAISVFDSNGVATSPMSVSGLAVDVARDLTTGLWVIARPGSRDLDAPISPDSVPFLRTLIEGASSFDAEQVGGPDFLIEEILGPQLEASASSLVFVDGMLSPPPPALDVDAGILEVPVCLGSLSVEVPGQVTAVAFTPDGALLAQSREPARLFKLQGAALVQTVELGGDSVQDTGHDLFHRLAGAGIACAQCHPEGGEDGHVWNFSDVGPRRTQPLFVRLAGTAPFHWSGELADLSELMGEVFVKRMGGIHQVDSRMDALQRFLFALTPPPPPRDSTDPAALRGKVLFESLEVGCIDCHGGPNYSDNESHDIVIESAPGATQSPSLVGVAYRAPFMHTGCAPELMGRFDPACGGADHGNVAELTESELQDLVAFMQSL